MADPTTESLTRAVRQALHFPQMPSTLFKRNATYADLDLIPDNHVGEIIDGDLYSSPRPASPHAMALGELHLRLGPATADDGPEGWIILMDTEVRFGPHLLVPDVVGWRRARMPVMPDVAVFELAPDWVCEVMSPSTAPLDRGRKREIYATGRVPHVWYLDPQYQTLDVLTLDGASYRITTTGSRDDRGSFAPFDRCELDLARLWRR